MGTYLDEILDFHRYESRGDSRSLDTLVEKAGEFEPTRGFKKALMDSPANEMAVIAEIKKRSPSLGELVSNLIPSSVSQEYEEGGASALSVLTDAKYFGGSSIDLREARAACNLPVLRKDFTVDFRDICDAKIMGANCVLLIVAALEKGLLTDFIEFCENLELDALVEAHDEVEVEVALESGATMIGINQRDLKTFKVDQNRALRVVREIPKHIVKVAESGIRSISDAEPLKSAGFDAVLIGESLVKSHFPDQLIAQLRDL